MKVYRVHVIDRVVRHLYKDFQTGSEEEARTLAEAEEWGEGEWIEDFDDEDITETYIESVEEREESVEEES